MKIQRMTVDEFNKLIDKLSPLKKIESVDNKIVNIDGKIYNVDFYRPNMENPKKNTAYIIENMLNRNEMLIIPYRGRIEKVSEAKKPGFYRMKNTVSDDYINLSFGDYDEKMKYFIDKIILLDPDSIYSTLTKSAEISNIVNEITQFQILENDNVLMKLLKMAINKKGIDINQYKGRFVTNTEFTNAMKPLKGDGGLSLQMFLSWCDKLDIEWQVTIKDKHGCKRPFGEVLSEQSFYF